MHQDCDRCGVFGRCDKEGICYDCREEEVNDEQVREETLEEAEEDEGETSDSGSSSKP